MEKKDKDGFIWEDDWFYYGIIHYEKTSCGHRFVKVDKDFNIIEKFTYDTKKINEYILGRNFQIQTLREDGKAKTIRGRRCINELKLPEKILSEWRKKDFAQRQELQQYKDNSRLQKESVNIENMTLKELKDFSRKNYTNKRLVVAYIMSNIL